MRLLCWGGKPAGERIGKEGIPMVHPPSPYQTAKHLYVQCHVILSLISSAYSLVCLVFVSNSN